jgi:hypothetical protein
VVFVGKGVLLAGIRVGVPLGKGVRDGTGVFVGRAVGVTLGKGVRVGAGVFVNVRVG